ncbi:hypothetical protein CKO35_03930 [Ectothiorhodospira shaposhnikovii]|uniref:PRC-barrel domain-containing protein n=1 Tax=Ectothiorhodospira shaposhnikovii TaxID=1054 RepID=UPI001908689A|nr:PRC-barrel domain-containing protein [Ectothiorhodospira shaposhnikovii]MBK1672458.1 hypothetical protein [Ectothiorhodospira shaposhnikovii]
MKKLHALAVCALLTHATTLGIGSALAQAQPSAHGICLSSQPANSFHPNTLIVSDLLIDEDGQIVAVIVKVGGFLGMDAKEVAIFLDSVEPSLNEKDKGYDFGIRSTEDTLREAPELTDVDSRPLSSQSR